MTILYDKVAYMHLLAFREKSVLKNRGPKEKGWVIWAQGGHSHSSALWKHPNYEYALAKGRPVHLAA
jgi:hypothetical protein